MIGTALALRRLIRAVLHAARSPEARAILLLTAVVIAAGVVFYVQQEGWTVVDAVYFTVMTLTTVGYGDLAPSTDLSKLFTVVYAVVGIGLMASAVGVLAAAVLEGAWGRTPGRDRPASPPEEGSGASR